MSNIERSSVKFVIVATLFCCYYFGMYLTLFGEMGELRWVNCQEAKIVYIFEGQ